MLVFPDSVVVLRRCPPWNGANTNGCGSYIIRSAGSFTRRSKSDHIGNFLRRYGIGNDRPTATVE